jgi:hypothetical protein
MAEWFSIEVTNGVSSARLWAEGSLDLLVDEAITGGASEWAIQYFPWGCVIEIEFVDEATFEVFRNRPSVVAALDRVPDPVSGLLVHRGRGGSSGSRRPRGPLPMRGSDAAALPIPDEVIEELITQQEAAMIPRSDEPKVPVSVPS